jgi:hypothetical protein
MDWKLAVERSGSFTDEALALLARGLHVDFNGADLQAIVDAATALAVAESMGSAKARREAAELANRQLQDSPNREGKTIVDGRPKARANHYGKQELRELLDFIYGGPPQSDDERVA